MAEIKRFIVLDDEGQIVQQTDSMTIEVDAGVTARSVVNKTQLDTVASDAATAVTSEQTRAQTAEAALGDSISNLQSLIADLSSGTSGDLTLVNNRITQEISDRTEDVNSEEARAIAAEAALQALIDAEVLARTAADTAEATARDAADVALGLRIDGETAARATLDTTLRGLISAEEAARIAADSSLNAALAQEITDRTAADTALQANITAEATTRAAADVTLQANIDAEASARTAADTALQTEIDAEETRALAAEAALQTALDGEIATRGSEITRVEGLISAEVTARAAADTAEAAARLAADTALAADLAAEVTRATGEEARIEAKYDAGIAAEITAREAGDLANSTAISAEAARATAAEALLSSGLTTEIARATSREDSIEAALNAEISRATAEEIAVENRAKAYADARLQGFRVKGSVDYALTRFVPAYGSDGTFAPQLRLNSSVTFGELSSPEAVTYPKYTKIETIPEFLGVATDTQFRGMADGMFARAFSRYVDGLYSPVNADTPVSVTVDGVQYDASLLEHYADYGQTALGNARWAAANAQGYGAIELLVDVVDLAEQGVDPATGDVGALEKWYELYSDYSGIAAKAGARIALVQNSIGRDNTLIGNSNTDEVMGSGYTYGFYLDSAAINALPVAERQAAMADRFGHGPEGHVELGIYERKLVDGEYTFQRSDDFAAGMDVNGAYVVTEQGVVGPVVDGRFDGVYWNYYLTLDTTRLTGQYVGLVYGYGGHSAQQNVATAAIVGTNPLIAKVFNRVGSYTFTRGLRRSVTNPTEIEVATSRTGPVVVTEEGLNLSLDVASDYDPRIPNRQHLATVYSPNDVTRTYSSLTVVGPLVEGSRNSADELHSHRVNAFNVKLSPSVNDINNETGLSAFNSELGALFGTSELKAVRPKTNAEAEASDTETAACALQFCTWDSPAFSGIVYGDTTVARPSFLGLTAWDGTVINDHFYQVRVATSGSFDSDVHDAWFVGSTPPYEAGGDVLYVGELPGQFVSYNDVPSGKWAIPVLKRVGGIGSNQIAYVVLDRPAYLKA